MTFVTTKGRLLLATPAMADDNFDRTAVLMVEHTEEGALGVVLNRPGGVPVAEILPQWEELVSEPAVMFVGGPVERDAVLALGAHRDLEATVAAGTTLVVGSIGVVDLSRDATDLALELSGLRLFSGYAGWGPGQLDDEISNGGWMTVAADPDDVLTPEATDLWVSTLRRQPEPALRRLALYPEDLTSN